MLRADGGAALREAGGVLAWRIAAIPAARRCGSPVLRGRRAAPAGDNAGLPERARRRTAVVGCKAGRAFPAAPARNDGRAFRFRTAADARTARNRARCRGAGEGVIRF